MTLRDLSDLLAWTATFYLLGRIHEAKRTDALLNEFSDQQTKAAWAAFKAVVGR